MPSLQLLIDLTFQDIPLKLVIDSVHVFQSCNLLAAERRSSYNDLLTPQHSGHLPPWILSYDSRSSDSVWICLCSAKKVRLWSFRSWKKSSPVDWLRAVKLVVWMEVERHTGLLRFSLRSWLVLFSLYRQVLCDFEWHQNGYCWLVVRWQGSKGARRTLELCVQLSPPGGLRQVTQISLSGISWNKKGKSWMG